jgi:hypothetical protein
VAQVLLRAGDPRCTELMERVAALASPTGQWPEAIHPRTGGGCMGDGQHSWAAAEWVLYLRNAFVREDGAKLILGSGIAPSWLAGNASLGFGPAPTPFGPIEIEIETDAAGANVHWRGAWRAHAPEIHVRLPGFDPGHAPPETDWLHLARRNES